MDTSLREVFDRYGPMLALCLTIALLVVFLPSNNHASKNAVSAGGPTGGQPGLEAAGNGPANGAAAAGGASTAAPGGGGTSAAAAAGQTGGATAGSQGQGSQVAGAGGASCRSDGRQAGISRYMTPCAQYNGQNGGGTAKGVFPDHVKVAYYTPKANAATQAALKAAGVQDDQADIDRVEEILRRYYNDHYQTYGREVQFTKEDASGDSSDDVAMKADAHRLADKGYFAAFTAAGTSGSSTFDATLNSLGVLCIACTVSQAKSFYDKTKGYNFGALPMLREYYSVLAEYWGKRLVGNGRTAKWAGAPATPADVDLRKQPRKFGLIWLNANMGTVDPGAQEERDYFINRLLPQYGISGVVDASYNFDVTQGPQEAQTIIAKMNTSHVTTITMVADPLFPEFFTREASKEQYYPEWFISGTALTDTTFFGRIYDQDQWQHAYGVSPLWVFFEHEEASDGYREYHHVCPQVMPGQCDPGKEGTGINVYRTALIELYTGVEMAGPKLTPQTFAQGMYNYPATGGSPAYPLVKMTPDSPVLIKDFTEVWWNRTGRGKDEVNQDNNGILMKAGGGKRYLFGQWPTSDPSPFDPNGAVFTSDTPYLGPDAPKHEQDGHKHPGTEKCLSCS